MNEQNWRPLFRTPKSTVTKVLQSPAFLESRGRALTIVDDPVALRDLADEVAKLVYDDAPLSAIADRVAAAMRFLHTRADLLEPPAADAGRPPWNDGRPSYNAVQPEGESPPVAGRAARERLIVAALHYLITPVDLVPDFRVGGYIDDVLLLSWVFGAAAHELDPFLEEDPDA